ncbi:MAG: hypothetical protein JWP79_1041 [Polaromonas sp.]|jgi:hypothetical protein|nr:hypothetical protein [Polaromonas sp.]MDB5843731.1 hypothetical protein [Polaromonas sp.]MDB5938216.1 hypothetical protein [Polaromonas sp.]
MSRLPGPPAYVPTLTEIVPPPPSRKTGDESAAAATSAATDLQALMVQRVLRHVDGALEKRLHEATEQLIREHVQALLPQLHAEIERVVREAVGQALEREMPASRVQSGRLESRHS